jgi:hypothetical protein
MSHTKPADGEGAAVGGAEAGTEGATVGDAEGPSIGETEGLGSTDSEGLGEADWAPAEPEIRNRSTPAAPAAHVRFRRSVRIARTS